jgi:hypothetical protein
MQKWLSKNLLQNSYIFGLLALFLTMYGPRLHIGLPKSVRSLFSNSLFRALVLFIVVYMAHHDITMALTITIIFVVVMYGVQMTNILEGMYEEHYENYGKPVADCSNYQDDNEPQPTYKSS